MADTAREASRWPALLRSAGGAALRLAACALAHTALRWQYAAHCQNSFLAVLGLEPFLADTPFCRALHRGMQVLPVLAAVTPLPFAAA